MELKQKFIELLNKRGITSEEDIREYLSDKPQKTYDPFLLLNMEAGVDLILSAIEADEKICIYGDYDADGITSTVIMLEVLSNLTKRLMYYIPSRFDEGYGMNRAAVEKIHDKGVDLIITVDCGSVSCDEVDYARSLGMEVLVTDHHTITDKKASGLVINPTQKECPYPFKYLAGCGVAFKVAQAIVAETGLPKSILTRTLDLVGIGTIGDIVPLIGENRTLAKYGLRAINTSARENLGALIEATGLHPGHITAENVSFVIVPHLNAAGRMDHASKAVEMLMEKDPARVRELAMELAHCNSERKHVQEGIYKECVAIVDEKFADSKFLVIDLPNAHEGVTGIVAGKIKDRYYKPTIIVTPTGDGCLKGTGRSIDGVNIYDMLKDNEELFLRFGGHAAACGFTMKEEDLQKLRGNLDGAAGRIFEKSPETFDRNISPELKLEPADIDLELMSDFDKLEPCGCANTKPLVSVRGNVANYSRIGNQNQYMRFTAEMDGGITLPCVDFRDADSIESMFQKEPEGIFDFMGYLAARTWKGNTTIQMTVENAQVNLKD
ncbi:single-stranded-DNA-specific exonuclease RecJ [Aminicella lysinilytica]|uniref:single-stranded-DNA-specific exonuclease RecJ n=1 Tax=Aminicella lysinilytica TaxID=433323 RepID=UPI0026E9E494|nr:single-stranded-DNA-specific exonuclease RecJ [Aminicella lysinilytica]